MGHSTIWIMSSKVVSNSTLALFYWEQPEIIYRNPVPKFTTPKPCKTTSNIAGFLIKVGQPLEGPSGQPQTHNEARGDTTKGLC